MKELNGRPGHAWDPICRAFIGKYTTLQGVHAKLLMASQWGLECAKKLNCPSESQIQRSFFPKEIPLGHVVNSRELNLLPEGIISPDGRPLECQGTSSLYT